MASKSVIVTTSTAAWRVVASDGTLHTDIGAMTTAGKTLYPGLDAGGMLATLRIRTLTSALADGAACLIGINRASAPSDTDFDYMVSGNGQVLGIEGFMPPNSTNVIRSVWIRKLTAGDYVQLGGVY